MKATEKIWRNGEFIAWDDAKIHVLSHVVSYGSSVFEGIRCYETASGPAVFRLLQGISPGARAIFCAGTSAKKECWRAAAGTMFLT